MSKLHHEHRPIDQLFELVPISLDKSLRSGSYWDPASSYHESIPAKCACCRALILSHNSHVVVAMRWKSRMTRTSPIFHRECILLQPYSIIPAHMLQWPSQ
jgi:hypothetical protein